MVRRRRVGRRCDNCAPWWVERQFVIVLGGMSEYARQQSLVCHRKGSILFRQGAVPEDGWGLRTWIYLPNLDELSLRVVFALPNASRMGFVAKICLSISLDSSRETLVLDLVSPGGLTEARYRMMNLACEKVNKCSSALNIFTY